MLYKQTTQVPNALFDFFLPTLTISELKVFLTILRQTWGWVDVRSGARKIRDRITIYQFHRKTGLSRRVISIAIQSLIDKKLILVMEKNGSSLNVAKERKGKVHLFYMVNTPSQILTAKKSEIINKAKR